MLPQQQTPLDLERARVRDLMKYYTPQLNSQRSSISTHWAPDVSSKENCDETGPSMPAVKGSEAPDDSKRLTHDSTLTAFAQLGAFRLECERSFISLMDHDNQYILAEATRSVSLHNLEQTDPGDEVYLGPRMLDLMWGVCPSTIEVFTAKDGSLNINTPQIKADPASYVMNDLSQMDSFRNRPYVSEWPFMKFYAEVPITSPTGYVIGTFCVVDNKPRDGLDSKGLQSMTEISSAIMKHLELVQMQNHFHRADKMLHGLGMFVEKRSIPEDWTSPHGYDSIDLSRLSSLQPGMAHTISTYSDNDASDHGVSFPTTVTAHQTPMLGSPPKANMSYRHSDIHPDLEATTAISSGLGNSPSQRSRVSTNTFSPIGNFRERGLTMRREGAFLEPLASEEMQKLFSRACYRIREGLELDGVMLIDACFQDIDLESGVSTGRSNTLSIPSTAAHEDNEWTAIHDSSQANRPSVQPSSSKTSNSGRALTTEVFGHSIQGSALKQELPFATGQIPLRRSTLRSLLRTFREGTVFGFERDGEFIQNSDPIGNDLSVTVNPERLKKWANELLSACPGARSIMFFPLWDNHFDQWFAGVLALASLLKDHNSCPAFGDALISMIFPKLHLGPQGDLLALRYDNSRKEYFESKNGSLPKAHLLCRTHEKYHCSGEPSKP
ncbi:hypothetical protein ONS95_000685 [Cadophora gregata]|uniref:uncharacterized protein n=1 Tax=Cadophora gregata TaxID=51156 RepID=UPI0026DD91F1|nr:uncharacterized protein ONS95_000685 [Cadophora gregata]KAK0128731.1 hypothetical protein ONS95_000685 [Cadophora gregata]